MSITSSYSPDTYNGDNSTTSFAITFSFLSTASNVQVSLKNETTGAVTVKTNPTHYSISGTNVVFVTAPTTNEQVIIELSPDFTQDTDYTENSALSSATLETDLDERNLEAAHANEKADRSLKIDPVLASSVDTLIPIATMTGLSGYSLTVNTNENGFEFTNVTGGGGGGGLSNVVEDLTPQLGGDLDMNGNQITSPDGTDLIDIPNGSIDLQTASSSRLDITDAGVRLGGANARVTTVLDEDTMSSNSATSLATQQSIKAYVDAQDAAILDGSTYTGAHDFGGATSIEIPNGTTVTTNAAGEIALDTNGNGTSITTGVIQVYDGTQNTYVVSTTNYPSSDNDVPAYDAGTNSVTWQAQSGAGGGISNVVEDTTPQLGGQLDVNGNAIGDGTNELVTFTEDASAVNHVNIENEATGSGPIISAAGDDANIDLNLRGKATGNVILNDGTDPTKSLSVELGGATTATTTTLTASQTGNRTVTLPDATTTLVGTGTTDTLTNKTLTTPVIGTINDSNGNESLIMTATGSAVNEVTLANAATGNDPTLTASGGDTNVGISLQGKGTGNITLGNFVFDADQTVGAGQDNYVLTYDNAGGLISLEAASGGSGSGKILQVQTTTKTDTFTSTANDTWTDITGMSVSITPSSTSNTILIHTSVANGKSDGFTVAYRWVRDSTAIGLGAAAGSRTPASFKGHGTNNDNIGASYSYHFVDSPATTSAITYKLQFYTTSGTTYINRANTDTDNADSFRFASTITVMEIDGT